MPHPAPSWVTLAPRRFSPRLEKDLAGEVLREQTRVGGDREVRELDRLVRRAFERATLAPSRATPAPITEADLDELRALGQGDAEILDANNMCAPRNSVNWVANGLGLTARLPADFPAYAAILR